MPYSGTVEGGPRFSDLNVQVADARSRRGIVRLQSANPADQPVIDMGWFLDPGDRPAAVAAGARLFEVARRAEEASRVVTPGDLVVEGDPEWAPAGREPAPRRRSALRRDAVGPFGERCPQASARIMSDARSAIIMTGAWMLPEVIDGITDASATHRPSKPRTRRRGSTTAPSSLPMRHVPHGW